MNPTQSTTNHPDPSPARGVGGANKATECAGLVTEMRRHWKCEAAHRERGELAKADDAKRRGDAACERALDLTRGRLLAYANAYLHDTSLTTDGARDLTLALYQKWQDLGSGESARGWEKPVMFWTCLKRLAYNLFTRGVQRGYGREWVKPGGDSDAPAYPREQREADRPLAASGDDTGDMLAESHDPDSNSALKTLFEEAALDSLLEAVRDPRHREAILLSVRGLTHAAIARILGVRSEKTVYNYIERARADMHAWARARHASHGEYGDYLAATY